MWGEVDSGISIYPGKSCLDPDEVGHTFRSRPGHFVVCFTHTAGSDDNPGRTIADGGNHICGTTTMPRSVRRVKVSRCHGPSQRTPFLVPCRWTSGGSIMGGCDHEGRGMEDVNMDIRTAERAYCRTYCILPRPSTPSTSTRGLRGIEKTDSSLVDFVLDRRG